MPVGILQWVIKTSVAFKYRPAAGTAELTHMRGAAASCEADTGKWGACAFITLPTSAAASDSSASDRASYLMCSQPEAREVAGPQSEAEEPKEQAAAAAVGSPRSLPCKAWSSPPGLLCQILGSLPCLLQLPTALPAGGLEPGRAHAAIGSQPPIAAAAAPCCASAEATLGHLAGLLSASLQQRMVTTSLAQHILSAPTQSTSSWAQ